MNKLSNNLLISIEDLKNYLELLDAKDKKISELEKQIEEDECFKIQCPCNQWEFKEQINET